MGSNRKAVAPVVAALILLALSLTVAFGDTILEIGKVKQGSLIPLASATEESLTKEVGDVIYFKAKVKNTGSVETGYIIVAKWAEHGTGEWETACTEDLWLEPGGYGHVELGCLELVEGMVGKYFDVKFMLYEYESGQLLDERTVEMAFYVEEPIVAGSIIESWVY